MLTTIGLSLVGFMFLVPIARLLVAKSRLAKVQKALQIQDQKTAAVASQLQTLVDQYQPLEEIQSRYQTQQGHLEDQAQELARLQSRLNLKFSESDFATINSLILSLQTQLRLSTSKETDLRKLAQPIMDRLAAEQRRREEAERIRRQKEEQEERERRRKREQEEEEERQARRRREDSYSSSSSSSSSWDSGSSWSGGGGSSSGGGASDSW
jgi:uncharacterized membrane protein YgcG